MILIILIDEKSHESILIYGISYKTLIDWKPLHIRFFVIDAFIRIYDGARHDAIYSRIIYLLSQKSGIPYIFSRYFTKIKVDSYDTFPKEKRLSLHNVIIIIKSILNKDQSHFYHKIFSEKYSYQLDKK